jgi:ABC-2 type transport system ATP-binding protein
MEQPREPVIVFRHVSVSRPSGRLSALSFVLGEGESYAWLGGPGSGKTVIVDLVMGFCRPDFGATVVLGHDPVAAPMQVRRRVSFIDGRGRLPGPMTPVQGLMFLASLSSVPTDTAGCINALRMMGLPDRHLEVPVDELPTAAHVSVSLALAQLRSSVILVLDDPTVGLDSVATAQVTDALAAFQRKGTTILLTTSDVLVAATAADHVGILKSGTRVAERHRHQLVQASLTSLYADYIGRKHTPDR